MEGGSVAPGIPRVRLRAGTKTHGSFAAAHRAHPQSCSMTTISPGSEPPRPVITRTRARCPSCSPVYPTHISRRPRGVEPFFPSPHPTRQTMGGRMWRREKRLHPAFSSSGRRKRASVMSRLADAGARAGRGGPLSAEAGAIARGNDRAGACSQPTRGRAGRGRARVFVITVGEARRARRDRCH